MGEGTGVGEGLGLGVAEGVGEGLGLGVGVGLGFGVGLALGVGVGLGFAPAVTVYVPPVVTPRISAWSVDRTTWLPVPKATFADPAADAALKVMMATSWSPVPVTGVVVPRAIRILPPVAVFSATILKAEELAIVTLLNRLVG